MFAAATTRQNILQGFVLKTEKALKDEGSGAIDCIVSKDGKIASVRCLDRRAVILASS